MSDLASSSALQRSGCSSFIVVDLLVLSHEVKFANCARTAVKMAHPEHMMRMSAVSHCSSVSAVDLLFDRL
jgi:hypothetical protein